ARLGALDLHQAVLQQPRHGRVHLAVVERPVAAEVVVEGALEVVPVAGTGPLQQSQQGVADRHGEYYTSRVYTSCIHGAYTAAGARREPDVRSGIPPRPSGDDRRTSAAHASICGTAG